jgi:hypothetical protein
MGGHVCGVLTGEPAAPPAYGCTDSVDNESFTHYFDLT